jgi:hypothetical protein
MRTIYSRLSGFRAAFFTLLAGLAGLLGSAPPAWAQAPTWQQALSGSLNQPTQGTASSFVTAADASGNVFIVGSYTGQVLFGGTLLTTTASSAQFLAKWNAATSTWAWASTLPGTYSVAAMVVSGTNVYMTGSFSGTTTIAGTSLTSAGSYDIYLARFSDTGTALGSGWAVRAGGKASDYGTSLAVSGSSVYVTGSFAGTAVVAGTSLTSTDIGADIFVAKYVDNGTSASGAWARRDGGISTDASSSIAVSGTSVYVGGNFGGATVSYAGTTLANLGALDEPDMFVAKYVDNGTSAGNGWAVRAGSYGYDNVSDLVVSGTSLYLVGRFGDVSGTIAGQTVPGSAWSWGTTGYLAKYTDAGTRATGVWATSFPATTSNAFVLALSSNALYVTGSYRGTATIAGQRLTSVDDSGDIYVAKFLDNGTSVGNGWAATAGGGQGLNGYDSEGGYGIWVSGSRVFALAITGELPARFGTAPPLVAPANGIAIGELAAGTGAWQQVTAPLLGTTSATRATATDASGNVFVTGTFSGSVVFGTTRLTSQGSDDVFVAKWNPTTTTWAWAVSGGSPGTEQATGIAVSGANVYVTGSFAGSAYLAGTTLTSAGSDDIFVAKYVDNGTSAANGWARRDGGTGTDVGTELAASGSNVYVTGSFSGSATLAGTALSSAGGTDVFVAKYVDNGTSAGNGWAVRGGGSAADTGNGIALSGSNVYVTGSFTGTAASVAGTTLASAGGTDLFVAKYVDNGASASNGWAVRGGGPGADVGNAIALSNNDVYVTGSFAGSATLAGTPLTSVGSDDVFVAKYVDNGTAAGNGWATSGGGAGSDVGNGLAVRNATAYVTGSFTNSASLAGSFLYGSGQELFLARFLDGGTTAGNGLAVSGGGSGADNGYGLAINGNAVYVVGGITPQASFSGTTLSSPLGTYTNFLGRITENAPTISSFTPTSGYEGVTVTISGTNLSSTSVISFSGTSNNTVNSDFVANSAGTQLSNVIVPVGAQTGPISVQAAGGIATSAGVFTITATIPNPVPVITALTPASVAVGSPAFTLTLTGTGFVPRCVVRLNGVALPTTLVSATQVMAAVPASALTTVGNYPVTVTNPTPAGGTSAAATLAVTAPALASFTPASGPVGTTLTLTGSGLTGTSVITFTGTTGNTVTGGFTVNSAGTQITNVIVPAGAQTGPIRVTTPYGPASSPASFTVTPPVITSFTPDRGPVGASISLSGLGFTDASVITFAGSSANTVASGFTVNSTGTTITRVLVPAGAQTGPISVTTPKGTGTSTTSFTVTIPQPPVLSSFTPASGPVGTRLTINGTDLTNTSVITFSGSTTNTVTTGFTVNAIGTQITGVVVPAGAQTGLIQVTTPLGSASSPTSFVVTNATTPALTSFSPASAPAGTRVTVAGSGLSGVTAVTVNGAVVPSGNIFSLTSSSFAFVVPAGATATGTTSVSTTAGTGTSSAFQVTLRATAGTPAINSNRGAVANSAVAATFSEPVTGTASLLVYSAQAGGRKAGTVSASGTGVSFAATPGLPTSNFKPGETVQVTLPATTRTTNNILATKQVYQFTTATGGAGRGTFMGGSNPTGAAASWAITTGDVDGDGDLDLLTGNVVGNVVSLLRNTGNGTFGPATSIGVGIGPNDLALADVDGDGDLDLLAANLTDNTVSVRVNNGTGTFSGSQDIVLPSNYSPNQLVLGDVDGDGDLDLLVGNSLNYTYSVALRLNGGDATGSNTGIFSGGQNVAVGGQSQGVALADIDGDGDLDLLAASITNSVVQIRLNGGDATGSNTGVFSGSGFVSVGSIGTPASIAMGDIDGDGDLDLLAANYSNDNVSVCFNKGNGNFDSYTANGTVPVGSGPYNIALADVDADGDLDFLTSNAGYGPGGNTVSVGLNGGDATGSNTGVFKVSAAVAVGNFPRAITVGDLDGDGDLDFATPSASTGQVSVRLNGGTTLAAASASAPAAFSLYPNPASRAATVAGLPAGQRVELFDAVGRLVATATADATGKALLTWPASVASGVYVLRAGTQARRLTIQ